MSRPWITKEPDATAAVLDAAHDSFMAWEKWLGEKLSANAYHDWWDTLGFTERVDLYAIMCDLADNVGVTITQELPTP